MHCIKRHIPSDKTVCKVAGNFMSARDTGERIATHYAGKECIGSKLVCDESKELQAKCGFV